MGFFKNWKISRSLKAWKIAHDKKYATMLKERDEYKSKISGLKNQISSLKTDKDVMDQLTKFLAIKQKKIIVKKGFIRKIIDKFTKPNEFLVRMKLRNGEWTDLLADAKKPYFYFEGGGYVIDESLMEWNQNAKMYCSVYHQELSFPIRQDINVLQMKKDLETGDQKDIDLSANPYVLKKYIEGEFVQKAAQGAEIMDQFSFLRTMLIINAIITTLCAVMLVVLMRKK